MIAHQYSWLKNEMSNAKPKPDLESQLNDMLDTLENILGKARVLFFELFSKTALSSQTQSNGFFTFSLFPKVELAVSLLMAARFGLTDSEILDILSFEDLFQSDSFQSTETYFYRIANFTLGAIIRIFCILITVAWAPACIFLAEFSKYLRSFIRWYFTYDSIVLQVQHEIMRKISRKRYKHKSSYARQLLHTYFTVSESLNLLQS